MLDLQTQINDKMRAVVIDWIVEVCSTFKLLEETLYLTINLFDRFLTRKIVISSELQLLALGALSIASKYEEIYAPEIQDYVYISDNTYSKEQIIKKEYEILSVLNFDILYTCPLIFLRRYHQISQSSSKTLYLAKFILEFSLLEYYMLTYSSSLKASAGLYVARKLLNYDIIWTEEMELITGYKEKDLKDAVINYHNLIKLIPLISLNSTKKKYSDIKLY